ncbi:HemK2/MTQ2 family protein methyltransferase [Streptomyces kaempferi]|uniref:HemK2/MTQ2 family protein methyltransferase n=1 Tax=Streptomyces kaempferi TaxID=333725 RepID=A0ABW3XQ95_9ACTN
MAQGVLPRLLALPGVYRPQADTHLLARALAREDLRPTTRVLDIGTGSGAIALRAASRGAKVTAVDTSWRAVATTRLNALHRRLPLRVLHGDFTARTTGQRFDLVLANPPYVPSPSSRLPVSGPELAWDAGRNGRVVIDRICANVPVLLHHGGLLLMVHSAMCNPDHTLKQLTEAGLIAHITQRERVPWGPVLRSRRAWLQKQGLAAFGEEREELVIIRAQAL